MSRKLRFVPIAAVTIFVALAAAGCGGSGSTSSHKLTALVNVADPICQKVAVKRESVNAALRAAGSSSAQSLQVLAREAPAVATLEHAAVQLLGTLKQAGSESKEWKTILLGMRLLAEDTTQLASAAKRNDIEEVHRIDSGGKTLREKLATIAKDSGFSYCGVSS
jgi:hypothetical protein